MASIQLKDEVWQEGTFTYHDGEEVAVKYRFKEKLMARTCDNCGIVFGLPKDAPNSSYTEAQVILWMTEDHPSHCDSILHDICSTECGHKLVAGGWRHKVHYPMDEDGQHPFVAIGAEVESFRMNVRNDLLSRADLLKEWDASGVKPKLLPGGHPAFSGRIGVAGDVRISGGQQGG